MSHDKLTILYAEDVSTFQARTTQEALPYRLDLLRTHGWGVTAVDGTRAPDQGRATPLAVVQRRMPASVRMLLRARRLIFARQATTLAVFESQGHLLALARTVLPWLRSRGRLFIVVCWLSERLPDLPRWRLLLLRTVYRGVDGVLFYSPNQGALLHRYLGVPHHKLHAVRFGIDLHEFPVTGRARQPFALSVGRDRGRDWKTTFEAVRGTGIPLKVLCRPKELAGLEVPEEVQVLGYVARERYIELVQTCRVVLLLTHDLAYPTGQSVLLEAMAAETCCVVSQTAALQEYFGPGPTMLAAPVGDAAGARTQLLTAWDDDSLRTTIGRAAALDVRQRGSAQVMCAEMDAVLRIGGGPCE